MVTSSEQHRKSWDSGPPGRRWSPDLEQLKLSDA
jgi:hypothetical protein